MEYIAVHTLIIEFGNCFARRNELEIWLLSYASLSAVCGFAKGIVKSVGLENSSAGV
jgi:hypothetical protein